MDNYDPNNIQSNSPQLEAPMSLGDWLITLVILMIPCVNIIMLFVWAFSSSTPITKRNFCRAELIVMAVVLVLYLIIVLIFGAAIGASMGSYGGYY